MERKVLARLQFELHYANPVPLLRLLAEVGRASLEVRGFVWGGILLFPPPAGAAP